MNWKTAAFLCLAGLSLGACNVSDPAEEKIQIGVDEELIVDMVQILHDGYVDLGLTFVSSTPYDCGGAGYNYNLFTTQDQVSIYLESVFLPQPCSPGPTPAREQIAIPSQPGTYAISIGIGDLIQNTGTLVIDDQSFRINLDQHHGIALYHDIMYRIPPYTIWGYVYHADQQSEVRAQVDSEFLMFAEPVNIMTGYYGLFNAIASSDIQILEPGLKAGTESFIYRYVGDTSDLTSKIEQLRSALHAGTQLKVFAWDGSVF